jgi:hypothetical protein
MVFTTTVALLWSRKSGAPCFAGPWAYEVCSIRRCHAETHNANAVVGIRVETRSRPMALRAHRCLDWGLGLCGFVFCPMRDWGAYYSDLLTPE